MRAERAEAQLEAVRQEAADLRAERDQLSLTAKEGTSTAEKQRAAYEEEIAVAHEELATSKAFIEHTVAVRGSGPGPAAVPAGGRAHMAACRC